MSMITVVAGRFARRDDELSLFVGDPNLSPKLLLRFNNLGYNNPRDNADVRQVAIALGVIQSVADHELIRNLEAHVIPFDGHFPARGLVEESRDLERPRLMSEE